MEIQLYDREYWYGTCVKYGRNMPFSAKTKGRIDFTENRTPNQAMPLLVSTRGRSLWRNTGFTVEFDNGILRVPDDCRLCQEGENLRDAYLQAMKRWLKPLN